MPFANVGSVVVREALDWLLIAGECHLRRCAPRANAIAERVVRSLRQECLDHILPLSKGHVRSVLAEFVSYYNRDRPTERSDWRLQCRAFARSTGRSSPGLS